MVTAPRPKSTSPDTSVDQDGIDENLLSQEDGLSES